MYTSLVTLVLRPLYPFQSFMMVLLSITIKIIINLDYNPVISSVRIRGGGKHLARGVPSLAGQPLQGVPSATCLDTRNV